MVFITRYNTDGNPIEILIFKKVYKKMIEAEQTSRQKPEIHINSITFNDGTTLSLESNSIVVFTGANNCGKSQVLKDIERYWFNKQHNLDKRHNLAPKVMTNIGIDFAGDINDKFFETRFYRDRNDGGTNLKLIPYLSLIRAKCFHKLCQNISGKHLTLILL